MTLVEFLRARLASEVEAKRRIIDLYEYVVNHGDARTSDPARLEILEDVLRLLALPYADHHDYDPAGWGGVDASGVDTGFGGAARLGARGRSPRIPWKEPDDHER